MPHSPLKIQKSLKTFGEFVKHEKKGWAILDGHYATIEVFKTR